MNIGDRHRRLYRHLPPSTAINGSLPISQLHRVIDGDGNDADVPSDHYRPEGDITPQLAVQIFKRARAERRRHDSI